ncbi:ABC transporter permease subunit [Georgenia sp. SUBG003]|uniref:ABC transporter permease subunit n=1 Tax=Georgenia sp. SUBG003 TaxID=1497974 RepID=UPI003AB50731
MELRRLFSRRLVVLAMAGALAVTGLLLLGVRQSAQPMSDEARAQAQAEYERARADWEENGEEIEAQCRADEELERESTGQDVDFGCESLEPQPEWFLVSAPELQDSLPGTVGAAATLLVFLAFLVGATFTAAEVSTGSLSTWLTFEPRRLRVYVAKLLAAALGVLPAAAVVLVVTVAGAWAVTDRYGLADGMTTRHWSGTGTMVLRILALTALFALVGAALGFLLRHTAAVLGVVVGYVIVVELMLMNYLGELQPWLVVKNVEGWINRGASYFVDVCTTGPTGTTCEFTERSLAFGHSAVYLVTLTAVVVLAGALVLRRRDAV